MRYKTGIAVLSITCDGRGRHGATLETIETRAEAAVGGEGSRANAKPLHCYILPIAAHPPAPAPARAPSPPLTRFHNTVICQREKSTLPHNS